jgi:hypothetical protein
MKKCHPAMNFDEASWHFVESFYDSFKVDPEAIDRFYSDDAKLNVSSADSPFQTFLSARHAGLRRGRRAIFRCNGQKNGDNVTAHVTGVVESEDLCFQTNEMFVYALYGDSFLIRYHSLHLSPLPKSPLEPEPEPNSEPDVPLSEPEPELAPPEPHPEPAGPAKVEDATQLSPERSVVADNLPFTREPSDVLVEFEVYGAMLRYATMRGKIAIEFADPDSVRLVMADGDFYWGRRSIRVKRMKAGFQ